MLKVLINKFDPSVELPVYKTNGASGMDLMAFIQDPINLKPHSSCLVPTGISVAFPSEFEIQIRPRSGLAAKNSISVLNTPGTIDSDYRGEICVLIINLSKINFIVARGMRIAQIIFNKIEKVDLEASVELDNTIRGEKGFGSTGLN